jgi:hypothetical protein
LLTRAAMRIDNYLDACRSRAAELPHHKWGRKVTTEQIGRLCAFRGEMVSSDFAPVAMFLERVAKIPTVFIVRDGRACIA